MNNQEKYDQQLDESGSYRAAMEKVLIRSFYDSPQDLHAFLYSLNYSFEPVERFNDQLAPELYDLYLEKVGLHQRRIQTIVDFVAPKSGERVLDLACNLGATGYHLSQRDASVIGLDLDLNCLHQCRQLWPEDTLRMPMVQANGVYLPYQSQSFDLVVAADFYEHIDTETKTAVTVEILRVLKPGGRLIIHTDNLIRYDISLKLRRFAALLKGQDPSRQKHHFANTHTDVDSAKNILKILTAHGFRPKAMSYFPGRFSIDPLIIRIPLIRRWLASSYLISLEKSDRGD